MKKSLVMILFLAILAISVSVILGCAHVVAAAGTTTTTAAGETTTTTAAGTTTTTTSTTTSTSTTTIVIIGELDTTFSTEGYVVHHSAAGGNDDDSAYSIALENTGKILVCGLSDNVDGNLDMVIWRYGADGILDPTFGTGGVVTHNNAAGGDSHDVGFSITTDSSDRILVTGYSKNGDNNNDMTIWRYDTSGNLDSDFDGDGIVVHDNAASGEANDEGRVVVLDGSDKIFIVGRSRNADNNDDIVIWKYETNGTLDLSFGQGGMVVLGDAAGGNGTDIGRAITLDGSGNIYVTGYSRNANSNEDMVIWKVDSDGASDPTFGTAGVVTHNGAAGGDDDDFGLDIAIDDSNKVLVAGYSKNADDNYDMTMWRYTTSGSLDATFDGDGIVVHANAAGGTDDIDAGLATVIDSSDRILVSGYSKNDDADYDMVIWRYDADGVLDTAFGSGEGFVTHGNAAGGNNHDVGWDMTLDASGKILVGGYSKNADNNQDLAIWRYR